MSDCNVYYFLDPECGKYKERGLKHSLDIWHAAKILGKKIQDPKIPLDKGHHEPLLVLCQASLFRGTVQGRFM